MRNEPAFPRPHSTDDSGDFRVARVAQEGMTIRTYIATQAMQAFAQWYSPGDADAHSRIARESVELADALIAELEK